MRVTCTVRPPAAFDPVRHLSTCPHLVFDPSGHWRLILHLVRVGALSITLHISVRIGLIFHLSQPCPHQHYSILLKKPHLSMEDLGIINRKPDRNLHTCIKSYQFPTPSRRLFLHRWAYSQNMMKIFVKSTISRIQKAVCVRG